ncbi:PepSY domain-containing protein [Altericroceibacterium spongiae]|uniref:PepSY domain-containing protein n=1 Tax=Altericroceibacterium spongiae TaxID=2320269 RepID=A0A420EE38_9SPHN|nr:PepSY-associated TM helix domain-containing protein [Altericroceibacterium spongiae]RKF18935.1 PepSY domain-containing protein [Altericroceibacterium spongiae]
MAKSFRQSQTFLHTWSGLLLGWLLFLVFITGTIAFYREGVNRWMHPEMARVEQPYQLLDKTQHYLEKHAPDAMSWFITMPNRNDAGSFTFWTPQPDSPDATGYWLDNSARIGSNTDPAHLRPSRGGEFFYRFHFDLHYMPVIWARWLVGLAAMMMLVAICSGVVAHKKIFKDFFTFRRHKGQRTWLDGHNATAVLALPFHLMITYTGLVTLMAMLMPWAIVANYENTRAIQNELFPSADGVEPTGKRMDMVPLSTLVHDAEEKLGMKAGTLMISNPGDEMARVTIRISGAEQLDSRTPSIVYNAVTGREIWRSPPPGGAAVTTGAMIGLHAARFSGETLRFLYFLAGVAGTIMVGSGLIMWTVKRREKLPDPTRPHFGFHLVERLNVATIAGFSLGIAAMFWANRLLPADLANRADTEINWLFISWGISALLALALRPKWSWTVLFGLTGAALFTLPFYNILADMNGLPSTIAAGDWVLAGIDISLLVFGMAAIAIALRIARYRPPERRRRALRNKGKTPVPETLAPEPAE